MLIGLTSNQSAHYRDKWKRSAKHDDKKQKHDKITRSRPLKTPRTLSVAVATRSPNLKPQLRPRLTATHQNRPKRLKRGFLLVERRLGSIPRSIYLSRGYDVSPAACTAQGCTLVCCLHFLWRYHSSRSSALEICGVHPSLPHLPSSGRSLLPVLLR
jgi:hypothetical protein